MKTISPRQVKTEKQLCSIMRDNMTAGDYWMSVGEKTVSLTHQREGEPALAQIEDIPKKDFNKLVDFYHRQYKRNPR